MTRSCSAGEMSGSVEVFVLVGGDEGGELGLGACAIEKRGVESLRQKRVRLVGEGEEVGEGGVESVVRVRFEGEASSFSEVDGRFKLVFVRLNGVVAGVGGSLGPGTKLGLLEEQVRGLGGVV